MHYFAHWLQLALILAAKNHIKVCRFLLSSLSHRGCFLLTRRNNFKKCKLLASVAFESQLFLMKTWQIVDSIKSNQSMKVYASHVNSHYNSFILWSEEAWSKVHGAVESFCFVKNITATNMESNYVHVEHTRWNLSALRPFGTTKCVAPLPIGTP